MRGFLLLGPQETQPGVPSGDGDPFPPQLHQAQPGEGSGAGAAAEVPTRVGTAQAAGAVAGPRSTGTAGASRSWQQHAGTPR